MHSVTRFSLLTSVLSIALWVLAAPPTWTMAAILTSIAASIAAILVQRHQYREWLKSLGNDHDDRT